MFLVFAVPIVAVAAGVGVIGALVVIMIIVLCICTRRKKPLPTHIGNQPRTQGQHNKPDGKPEVSPGQMYPSLPNQYQGLQHPPAYQPPPPIQPHSGGVPPPSQGRKPSATETKLPPVPRGRFPIIYIDIQSYTYINTVYRNRKNIVMKLMS